MLCSISEILSAPISEIRGLIELIRAWRANETRSVAVISVWGVAGDRNDVGEFVFLQGADSCGNA
jgi:hypothetical protein